MYEHNFKGTIRLLNGLDILINSAVYVAHREENVDFYDKMMDTNLKSIYMVSNQAVKYFFQVNVGAKNY